MDQIRLKSHQHNDAFKEIQGQNKLHFAAGDAVAHLKLKERSVSNFWDCCKDVEMGEYLGQLYRNWNCYNFDERKSSTYYMIVLLSSKLHDFNGLQKFNVWHNFLQLQAVLCK